VQKAAEEKAKEIVAGMNRQFEEKRVEGCVYNASSAIHIYLGKCEKCDRTICLDANKGMSQELVWSLGTHLLLNGLNLLGPVGWVSAVHSDDDIRQTVKAFGATLDGLLEEGAIQVIR
jgi:glutamate-1-semialdehyde aminotransferase